MTQGKRRSRKAQVVRFVFLGITLGFLVAVAVLRYTTYDTIIVVGQSMSPTLLEDDRLFANRRAYRSQEPQRGDIVIVMPEGENAIEVKRLIGLPGDVLMLDRGQLSINESPIDEGYVAEAMASLTWPFPVIVPKDAVFVMGDNRNFSRDSRDFGPIPYDRIRAKVTRVFYPFSRWTVVTPPDELTGVPRKAAR